MIDILLVRKNLLVLIVGFIVRAFFLFAEPMHDMPAYVEWGKMTWQEGLGQAYSGTYFPIQYLLFGWCIGISNFISIPAEIVIKLFNFAFETMTALLFFKYWKSSDREENTGAQPWMLYWLSPYILVAFGLGYIDPMFSFFVILFLSLCRKAVLPIQWLFAGTALAIAFLMKPQAQSLYLACFMVIAVQAITQRQIKPVLTLVPSGVLFVAFSLFLSVSGRGILYLTETYLSITNLAPSLSSNMPNFWQLLSFALRDFDGPIYQVSDKIKLLGPHFTIKTFAVFLVIGFLVRMALKLRNAGPNRSIPIGLTFAAFVTPFFMTSAHENHLHLFIVLSTALLGLNKKFAFFLSLTYAFNLIGLYWPNCRFLYPETVQFLLACAGTVLSFILLFKFDKLMNKAVTHE